MLDQVLSVLLAAESWLVSDLVLVSGPKFCDVFLHFRDAWGGDGEESAQL